MCLVKVDSRVNKIYYRGIKRNEFSHYHNHKTQDHDQVTQAMKRDRGSTIHRVLDILDTIAASDKPLSATEINEILNLPKATVHRLCAELEARGYLLKKINGKSYMPGNQFRDLAVGALSHSRFRTLRLAILQKLSERVGETCNIAYPVGIEMAYSDRVLSPSPLRLHLPIGTRVPLHCTASGKLFLASLARPKRIAVINQLNLKPLTSNTITSAEHLIEEVETVHKQQLAVDNEEIFEGVMAIGVPITDRKGRFYSSLAIQAPVSRLSVDQGMQYEPLLREAATELSRLTEE